MNTIKNGKTKIFYLFTWWCVFILADLRANLQVKVGNRPPGDCVGESRPGTRNAVIEPVRVPVRSTARCRPGGRQPTGVCQCCQSP